MEYTIDATDKVMGRLASEIAILLRGKNTPGFTPHQLTAVTVLVENVDQMRVAGKKMKQKLYRHHSGYHGGLKEVTLERLVERDSRLALRHAVMGMLPKNKLRDRMIKNLIMKK